MKILPVGAQLFNVDRQTEWRTDMTKLTVAFCSFAKIAYKLMLLTFHEPEGSVWYFLQWHHHTSDIPGSLARCRSVSRQPSPDLGHHPNRESGAASSCYFPKASPENIQPWNCNQNVVVVCTHRKSPQWLSTMLQKLQEHGARILLSHLPKCKYFF